MNGEKNKLHLLLDTRPISITLAQIIYVNGLVTWWTYKIGFQYYAGSFSKVPENVSSNHIVTRKLPKTNSIILKRNAVNFCLFS